MGWPRWDCRISANPLPLIGPSLHSRTVFRADSDNIDDLKRRVRNGVSKLRGLEVGDELGVEVLAQLVDGKMTASEIVERVYGITSSDEGFNSAYGKVRREIRKLESKGLVSRKLFGNEKPYGLTDLAVINLARIGREGKQVPVIPRKDIALYVVTGALSIPVILSNTGHIQLAELSTIGLLVFFCILFGISLCRFLETLRRVF